MSRGAVSRRNRSSSAANTRGGPDGSQLIGRGDPSRMPNVPVSALTSRLRPFAQPTHSPEPTPVRVFFVDPETLR